MTNKAPVITAAIPADSIKSGSFLEDILSRNPDLFSAIIEHKKEWNVQIIYTKADRGANGIAALNTQYYNVNPARFQFASLHYKG